MQRPGICIHRFLNLVSRCRYLRQCAQVQRAGTEGAMSTIVSWIGDDNRRLPSLFGRQETTGCLPHARDCARLWGLSATQTCGDSQTAPGHCAAPVVRVKRLVSKWFSQQSVSESRSLSRPQAWNHVPNRGTQRGGTQHVCRRPLRSRRPGIACASYTPRRATPKTSVSGSPAQQSRLQLTT